MPPAIPTAPLTAGTAMRAIVPRAPLPLLDALDCWPAVEAPLLAWLRAFALWPLALLRRLALWRPEVLRRLEELALRPLELRPLDALRPLELRPLDALRPLELGPLDALRPLDELARVLRVPDAPPLRLLPLLGLRLLALRLLALRPLPLLRVLPPPLPVLPPSFDPLAFWFPVRPRVDA
jgi:hypothetical protein